jgi:glycosyltransferase involved in cell wall biosynthesis
VPKIISLHLAFHGKRAMSRYLLEGNLRFACKGSQIINNLHPDMIIFNSATISFCPFFKVAVCHDFDFLSRTAFHKYYGFIMYRTFNKIVAPSTELGQEIKRQMRLPTERIASIPICINTASFSRRSANDRIHAILHVGPRRIKRPDITIDAFAKIARNDAKVQLFIAGQISTEETILLSQINKKEKDIRDRIIILDKISKEELANLYSRVKVTSVPSDYNIPVCSPTATESLAAGTPVVSSLSAVSQDILIDGYNGFRVPPHNTEMFASRLQLLIHNEQLWSKMSRNSLELAKRYDKKSVAKKYLSLYQARFR